MTPEQVEEALGENPPQGERMDNEAGPNCGWQDSETGGGFRISFSTGTGEGLSSYYANTQPQVQVFRELSPVGGFPAIAFQIVEEESGCAVAVGISDKYAVLVSGNASHARADRVDPCDLAERLAGMTVETLKQQAAR